MLRSVLFAVLLAAPAAAPHAQALEPVAVTYLAGGAVSGACRAQWQTSAAVRARSAPTDIALATRTIDAARRVDGNDYSESLTAVLEPGRVRLRAAVVVPPAPGSGVPALRLAAGDELRVLAASEGYTTFVYGGRVYSQLGRVVLQIFVPKSDGTALGYAIADEFTAIFRDWKSDDGWVRTSDEDVFVYPDGEDGLYQINVSIRWESLRHL